MGHAHGHGGETEWWRSTDDSGIVRSCGLGSDTQKSTQDMV
ncbi:hypothetical protein CCACVL1_23145 [Corchorus capsularis]|uniref:Uncharacterized protein n=1 Tax=Corchorus capsularis TaxID=210143 RepID=A0A1R3GUY3_COCAP|nr:hypothetical protein CCACVL1_23145 [Corchorus capsularis]